MTNTIVGYVPGGRNDLSVKENGEKWNNNTKYDPSFCAMIVQMGHQGASWAEMAIACDVSKQTADKWRKSFPEWDEAVQQALTASEAFRNRQGAFAIEWVNAKGEPQFRADVWKDLKTDVKIANQTKEEKDSSEVLQVVDRVTDMVNRIRGEEI